MDTELDVLAESFVELRKVVLVLSDLGEQVHALLDEVLANDLQDLILLKGLTGDVEGEILRVDDTLDKVEVLGNEILAVVHDEDATDVKLDVVALLLRLEEIEGSPLFWTLARFQRIGVEKHIPLGNEENGLELELTFNGEVLNGKVLFPVVGQTLVESTILVRSDILWVPRPDGLGLVEFLVLGGNLFDLLRLLGLVFFVINLLDLGLLLIVLDLFFVVFNFL